MKNGQVDLKSGDLVLVHWKDYASDGGDSAKAELAYFVGCGFFKEWKVDKEGEWVLILERNLCEQDDYAKGWDSFLLSGIVNLEVLTWAK
jgi:hypothetical protein